MIEATNDPQTIGQALGWIVSLLNRYSIRYQMCGGLAAKAYGATRPLVDIDIYAVLQDSPRFQQFMDEVQPYLIREFTPYHSASWDLRYLALNYQGVQVEIAESTTKPRFYNHRDGRWEDQVIDFAASTLVLVYGVEIALMPKGELLAYKAMLDREVDHLDIEQIAAAS